MQTSCETPTGRYRRTTARVECAMDQIAPRTKFWVTDPPAGYEDPEQDVVFMLVFTQRRKLLDYYQTMSESDGLDPSKFNRNTPIQKRWAQLVYYTQAMGWAGLNIDPDRNGPSTLVLLNSEKATAEPQPSMKPSMRADLLAGLLPPET